MIVPRKRGAVAELCQLIERLDADGGKPGRAVYRGQIVSFSDVETELRAVERRSRCCCAVHASDNTEAAWPQHSSNLCQGLYRIGPEIDDVDRHRAIEAAVRKRNSVSSGQLELGSLRIDQRPIEGGGLRHHRLCDFYPRIGQPVG